MQKVEGSGAEGMISKQVEHKLLDDILFLPLSRCLSSLLGNVWVGGFGLVIRDEKKATPRGILIGRTADDHVN